MALGPADGFLSTCLSISTLTSPKPNSLGFTQSGVSTPQYKNHILMLKPLLTLWNVLPTGLITGISSHPLLSLLPPAQEGPPWHSLLRADPNILNFSSCLFLSWHPSQLITVLSVDLFSSVLAEYKFCDGRVVLFCLLLHFKHSVNPCCPHIFPISNPQHEHIISSQFRKKL